MGCSAWPDCDVTFPLPSGKVEAVEDPCPTCGGPQVKVIVARTKPRVAGLDPQCATNYEPDVEVGPCPTCAKEGRSGTLIAQRNPKSLKRFIRCTEYDTCKTSYPLPARGELSALGRECADCGTPMVVVQSARGPWELCPNQECPGREKKESKRKGTGKGTAKGKATKAKASKAKADE